MKSGAAMFAGACAVISMLLGAVSVVLSVCVLLMHRSGDRVCTKFRHATLGRMMVTGIAGEFVYSE